MSAELDELQVIVDSEGHGALSDRDFKRYVSLIADIQTPRRRHNKQTAVFDKTNVNWMNVVEYRIFFFRSVQTYANKKLQNRGHVFLNEVFDELGLPHTSDGAIYGWRMQGDGAGYIDFGIFSEGNPELLNPVEHRLVFNVDGIMYDKI